MIALSINPGLLQHVRFSLFGSVVYESFMMESLMSPNTVLAEPTET
jgi:hypothetical protein